MINPVQQQIEHYARDAGFDSVEHMKSHYTDKAWAQVLAHLIDRARRDLGETQ